MSFAGTGRSSPSPDARMCQTAAPNASVQSRTDTASASEASFHSSPVCCIDSLVRAWLNVHTLLRALNLNRKRWESCLAPEH
jgi:hypothetical protein